MSGRLSEFGSHEDTKMLRLAEGHLPHRMSRLETYEVMGAAKPQARHLRVFV